MQAAQVAFILRYSFAIEQPLSRFLCFRGGQAYWIRALETQFECGLQEHFDLCCFYHFCEYVAIFSLREDQVGAANCVSGMEETSASLGAESAQNSADMARPLFHQHSADLFSAGCEPWLRLGGIGITGNERC